MIRKTKGRGSREPAETSALRPNGELTETRAKAKEANGEPESQLADVRTVRGGELSERLNGWRLWDECPPPLDEQVLLYSSEHKQFDTGCRTDFNGGGRVTRSMYGQWADYWHSLPAVPSASVPHIPNFQAGGTL